MKRLYLLSTATVFFFTFFLTQSCKKDAFKPDSFNCSSCRPGTGVEDSLITKTLEISQSDWVSQGDGKFSCDLNAVLQGMGSSANRVSSMYINNVGSLQQIFPGHLANCMGGTIYAIRSGSGDGESLSMNFILADQQIHYEEFSRGGIVPFRTTEFRLLLLR